MPDALSDVLDTVHLSGSLYCRSEVSAPWSMALQASDTAQFHVVRRGRCWLRLDESAGIKPLLLEAGDVVLLPHGNAHVLADEPSTPGVPLMDLIAGRVPSAAASGSHSPLSFGGGGERATLICGYFKLDRGAVHPLLSVLPAVVHVPGEGGRSHLWFESTLDLIAEESTGARPGGESLINRLTESLFIQLVRAHLEEAEGLEASWLVGLRDPQIAAALGLIHRELGEHWTVNTLAERVGMSRSAFSARFRTLVGEPPLQYLTRWRMQIAANHLQEGRLTLSEIADAVGYRADASFSKVFKRLLGVTPGAYRRQRAGGLVHCSPETVSIVIATADG